MKLFVKLSVRNHSRIEHEGERRSVASHANAKPRAVTNQCDRLINEEPPIPLPSSRPLVRGTRFISVFPFLFETPFPLLFLPLHRGQLLNVRSAGNPDIIRLSKDSAPMFLEIRETQDSTILTISTGIKFNYRNWKESGLDQIIRNFIRNFSPC